MIKLHIRPPSDLRLRRIRTGLTLAELARYTDISVAHLSQVERGIGDLSPGLRARVDFALTSASRERDQLLVFGGRGPAEVRT